MESVLKEKKNVQVSLRREIFLREIICTNRLLLSSGRNFLKALFLKCLICIGSNYCVLFFSFP
jgi:hypothetical protein